MCSFLEPKQLYCVEYKLNDSPIKYWYINAKDAVSAAKDIRRVHKYDKIYIVAAYPILANRYYGVNEIEEGELE